MITSSLDALKDRLPEYLQSLGLEPRLTGGRKLSCRCPLHADSKPSFTATRKDGVWLWHCFPCAKGGTIIDLHAALQGIDAREAIRELGERFADSFFAAESLRFAETKPIRGNLGSSGSRFDRLKAPSLPRGSSVLEKFKSTDGDSEPPPKPWPPLRKGTDAELAQLATLRGLPVEAIRAAQALGYLRFTKHKDYMPCYALTDGEHTFLQLRRLDGRPFPFPKNSPCKAWNWPGSKLLPLGVRHLDSQRPILMAEGAVSLLEILALQHLTHETQDSSRWRPLAMTSASARLPDDLLPKLAGRLVRIIGDRDAAGQRATQLWADQCRLVRCEVDVVDLSALPELDHQPKADLGDILHLPDTPHKTDILNHLVS